MKNICIIIAGLLLIAVLPSCQKIVGEGPVISQSRSETGFHSISVAVPADTYFTQGGSYSITIEAQQNILDEIETVLINSELRFRFRDPNTRIRSHEGITIHITAPDVTGLDINGSGNLQVTQPFTPSTLKLSVNGSGNLNVDQLTTSTIDASISGSGNIKVSGNAVANEEKVTISGSGYINLESVQVKNADAFISGSGTIRVYPTQTLKAKISGSGSILYKGSPTVSSTISGSGTVTPI